MKREVELKIDFDRWVLVKLPNTQTYLAYEKNSNKEWLLAESHDIFICYPVVLNAGPYSGKVLEGGVPRNFKKEELESLFVPLTPPVTLLIEE